MTVSMKANVLQRTTEHETDRPRFKWGIIVGIVAVLGIGTASSAVALGLVPHPFSAPAPVVSESPTPRAAITPSPAITTEPPSPSPTQQPAVADLTIPTTCKGVVAGADYTRFFGTNPIQQYRPVPDGAAKDPIPAPRVSAPAFYSDATLFCRWADLRADVSYLSVAMGTAPETETADNVAALVTLGFTCSEVDGGQKCQQITRNAQFPVDDASTFFVRGDTWIQIKQTNVPTDNLLGAIVENLGKG